MPNNIAIAIADKLNKNMSMKVKNNEYGIALKNYMAGFRGQGAKQLLISNYPANSSASYAVFGKTQAGIVAP